MAAVAEAGAAEAEEGAGEPSGDPAAPLVAVVLPPISELVAKKCVVLFVRLSSVLFLYTALGAGSLCLCSVVSLSRWCVAS